MLSCGLDKIERSKRGNESVPLIGVSSRVSNIEVANSRSGKVARLRERFNYSPHRRVCQSFENARVSKMR